MSMFVRTIRKLIIGSLVAVVGLATGLIGNTAAYAAPSGANNVSTPAHHKQAASGKHHRAKAKRHSKKKHHKKQTSKKHHKNEGAKKHHAAPRT
jgi:hypothetical protein